MISTVSSSRHLFSVAGVVTALVVSLWPRTGAAQERQQDDGWFEPPPAGAPARPAPAPAAEREPIPESPLLAEDGGSAASDVDDRDPRALTAWNAHLDPYGSWVDDPRYGRVWQPHRSVVGADFAPYVSSGRWALDENEDWAWVSDYPFGGVVFHYGRWVWISGRGWAWVPGLRYAPAWVSWRVPTSSYAYVGWAPMPPSYVWFGGSSVLFGYGVVYPWVFCPSDYLFTYHVHRHVLHDHRHITWAARYTRPYRPATPRGGYVRAAPRAPSVRTARVPARAIPRERVSSRVVAAGSPVTPRRFESISRRDGGERWNAVERRPQLDRRDAPERRELTPRPEAVERREVAVPREVAPRRERSTPIEPSLRRERPVLREPRFDRSERARPIDRPSPSYQRARPERSSGSHRRK
jgi:hypothetical protein